MSATVLRAGPAAGFSRSGLRTQGDLGAIEELISLFPDCGEVGRIEFGQGCLQRRHVPGDGTRVAGSEVGGK
jgi:hypothetical protein